MQVGMPPRFAFQSTRPARSGAGISVLCKRSIREWLGHSDISTTMNIYAHLDTTAKDVSAAAMSQALSLPEYNGGYGWKRN